MLRLLYPGPSAVLPGRRRGAQQSFLVLPSLSRPRIVVPAGHPAAAARMVRRQLTGRRPRTRLARLALSTALASGLLDVVHRSRYAVTVPEPGQTLLANLPAPVGADSLVAFAVGPPRANRKPVLQLTDAHGRVRGFAKVGHNELTRSLVRAEAAALDRLQQAGPAGLRCPGVLGLLEDLAATILVLEPLPIEGPQLSGSRRRAGVLAAVGAIAGLSRTSMPWSGSPLRSRLVRELDELGERGMQLRRHLLAPDTDDPELELGCWHGDLNPGNLAVRADGALVWDWERFEDGVPVGFDLLHHDLHEQITMHEAAPRAAAERLLRSAADTLAPLSVGAAAAPHVVRLYLITLAARYLRDGQDEHGSLLGRVGEWLLPALDGAGA